MRRLQIKSSAIAHCIRNRDSYFAALKLVGSPVFNFIQDLRNQRNAVAEAEAARTDKMAMAIWQAGED